MVGRYAGKIHFWTVINEAVNPGDGNDGLVRNSPWLEFLGPDYIAMAFRAAAEADPQALLLFNENDLEFDLPYQDRKRTTLLKLLERLKNKGVPVHALGMQAHIDSNKGNFNPQKLTAFMRDVADLGLKILITEMDVVDKDLPQDVHTRDRIVAGVYEDFLSVFLDETAVIAVMTWGLSDRFTWLSWFSPTEDDASVRPLPLDAQLNRKLAWNAVARAFERVPRRSTHNRRTNSSWFRLLIIILVLGIFFRFFNIDKQITG